MNIEIRPNRNGRIFSAEVVEIALQNFEKRLKVLYETLSPEEEPPAVNVDDLL